MRSGSMAVAERLTLAVRRFVVLFVAVVITLLALPAPIRSSAWEPPRPPNLEGALAVNDALRDAERLAGGQLVGPNDLALDAQGRIYAGTTDGKIVRMTPDGPLEVFTETGGRPLGLAFSPRGDLIVADGMKGLLRVDVEGHVEVLAREAEGQPLMFVSDVAVARDGTIYLTDSSARHNYGEQHFEILEAQPSGRLVRFDPVSRTSTVIARDLYFANGIALAPDESYALVAESGRYAVTRVWLSGDRRNLKELFVENLPGFPDDLSFSPRGTLWLALHTVRSPLIDAVHSWPFLKDSFAGLPLPLLPRIKPYGLVVELDLAGRPLRSLHDARGERFREVSAVVEEQGALLLGTFTGTAIGRLPL